MKIDLPISASGRYKVIKHAGHVFDADGGIASLGETLAESPWSDNLFLYGGRAFMLHDGANTISCSVDGYSFPPDYDGTLSGTAPSRSSSSLVSAATTRNITIDGDGRLLWRTTWRFNFPATPGLGTATYKRGGIVISSGSPVFVGSTPTTTARASTAMLKTPFGDEGQFTVDQETESFDVVWEFTEYVKAEATGTSIVRKISNGILVSDTPVSWTVRAANFDNTADATRGWMPITTADFPAMRSTGVTIGQGAISDTSSEPTFTETHTVKSFSVGMVSMTSATNSNAASVALPVGLETITDTIHFRLGHFDFQVALSPPVVKSATEEMTVSFNLTVN